jgi:hypothetical protein
MIFLKLKIKPMKRNYASFLKIGKKEYMEKLIYQGEIFCRTIEEFNSMDEKDFRGDKNEGASYIKQLSGLDLTIDGESVGKIKEGQLFGRHKEDKGNVYCLYGIETNTLNLEEKSLQKFNLELEGLPFGDTAVLIFDTIEFIKRLKKAIESSGYILQIAPAKYYDNKTFEGELTPFHKTQIHEPQKEIRFWIPNKECVNKIFTIGDMSDIAYLLPKDQIHNLGYEPI